MNGTFSEFCAALLARSNSADARARATRFCEPLASVAPRLNPLRPASLNDLQWSTLSYVSVTAQAHARSDMTLHTDTHECCAYALTHLNPSAISTHTLHPESIYLNVSGHMDMVCPTRIRAQLSHTRVHANLSLSRALSLSHIQARTHALSHPTVEQCRMGGSVNRKKPNNSKNETSTTANIQHALRNANPASSQLALAQQT